MNKYMYKRLMFPEPSDNGGSGGAAPAAPAAPADNPPADNGGGRGSYDFSGTPGAPPAAPPAEYALSFEDADGINDALRDMYTSAAKAADLPSDAASKFVHDVTVRSLQYQQQAFTEAETALQRDWGRDFSVRFDQTTAFARRLCDSAGLTNEQRAMFENPVGMRLFDALRRATSEGGATGMNQTTPPAPAKTPEEQIWALSKEIAQENSKSEPDSSKIQNLQKQISKIAGLI